MSAAAPSSVLLLGWDDTSTALPLAKTLAASSSTELWMAQPLPAATNTANFTHKSLDVVPPVPALPALGHRVPAFPYVGRGVGQPQPTDDDPVRVPAAPYLGSSETPPAYPASSVPAAINRTSVMPAADGPIAVPASPYVGATHGPAEVDNALQTAPVPDYRIPIGTLPAVPLEAPTAAEPGPAEAAELSSEQPATPDQELPAAPSVDSTLTAEPQPAPAAFDGSALDADEVALLTAGAAADSAALNFRIIQYARHAARLAFESEFEVIFAPDWHTWLAGIELRQLTRRPLVLHVEQLATDLATPAERGWVEALERITLPRADRILVPDEATAARLRQRYQLLAERLFVLAPGAGPDLSAALVLDSHFRA